MLSAIDLAAVDDLADKKPVFEELSEGANPESDVSTDFAVREDLSPRADALVFQILGQRRDRAECEVAPENRSHLLGIVWHNHDLLADAGVAQRNRAADPDAPFLGGRDLVADPLADDLAFKLGERHSSAEIADNPAPRHRRANAPSLFLRQAGMFGSARTSSMKPPPRSFATNF